VRELFLEDNVEAVLELLDGGVGGELESVEAGVAFGKGIDGIVGNLEDLKLVDFIPVALEVLEPQDGHSVRPGAVVQ
jgi:hypothetical protein